MWAVPLRSSRTYGISAPLASRVGTYVPREMSHSGDGISRTSKSLSKPRRSMMKYGRIHRCVPNPMRNVALRSAPRRPPHDSCPTAAPSGRIVFFPARRFGLAPSNNSGATRYTQPKAPHLEERRSLPACRLPKTTCNPEYAPRRPVLPGFPLGGRRFDVVGEIGASNRARGGSTTPCQIQRRSDFTRKKRIAQVEVRRPTHGSAAVAGRRARGGGVRFAEISGSPGRSKPLGRPREEAPIRFRGMRG